MPKKIAPHINTYCTYCKDIGHERVKALWRISYDQSKRACDAHKEMLAAYEKERDSVAGCEHYSEADYQTWMGL